MKTEMKVLLYLKRSEQTKDGLSPLMGKLTIKRVKNSSAQFGCKIKVDPKIWSATSQRCIGKSRIAIKTNKEIETQLLLLRQRFNELYEIGDNFTAFDVKAVFQGIAATQHSILKTFAEHNDEYSLRVGVNRAMSSYVQYKITLAHLTKFVNSKYKVTDMAIKQLDTIFIEEFATYLQIDKRHKPNTIRGHINRLKSVCCIAVHKGILDANPFKDYSTPKPERPQRYLSQEELSKIMNTTFDTPNRNFTRDMFIFSTMTGISYCDMRTLSENHLKQDDRGRLWIITNRQKTGTPENVMLLDIAIKIIDKYRGMAQGVLLFPMLTKESMNRHLKKIATICGIERNVSYHDSRHTFATQILLSQGVPIETVSRAMGHKNISTTQRYAKITHEKINKDVDIFKDTISGKFELNGIDSPPSTILKDMSNRKCRPSRRLLTSNGE